MAELNELLDLGPLEQSRARLGVDTAAARAAAATTLLSLLVGLRNNASSPSVADPLCAAIARHDAGLLSGGVDIDAVDTADGQKIVQHAPGDNQLALASRLGSATPGGLDLGTPVQNTWPMPAPVVIVFPAKIAPSLAGGQDGAGGIGLDGILGGLFGKK
ncbi:DUF937 domain-containing protein [Paeniglutamicibacter antarcticus]|uniref:DUF937 domain-containing protein n=1 Tax=Paeniglutamicibacter antarcticus TaxID=494023 RepID=A0ABP9TS35_9MICC